MIPIRLKLSGAAVARLLLAALGIAIAAPAHADILGRPKVMSGDTLEIGGQRIRLAGIMAPVDGQSCRVGGRSYDCHYISTTGLMDLTAGAVVRCLPQGQAPDGVLVAICYAGGYDLSEGMTYTGWALAYPRAGNPYLEFEEQARKGKHGLWRGEFSPPWAWSGSNGSATLPAGAARAK